MVFEGGGGWLGLVRAQFSRRFYENNAVHSSLICFFNVIRFVLMWCGGVFFMVCWLQSMEQEEPVDLLPQSPRKGKKASGGHICHFTPLAARLPRTKRLNKIPTLKATPYFDGHEIRGAGGLRRVEPAQWWQSSLQ